MGKGRRPKPHALKVLEGGTGKRTYCNYPKSDGSKCQLKAGWGTDHKGEGYCRHHEQDMEPVEDFPSPPDHLNEHGREFWNTYGPILAGIGLLEDEQMGWFTVVCELWGDWRWICEKAEHEKQDLLWDSSRGDKKQNPIVGMKVGVFKELRQWMSLGGLTPTTVAKLSPKRGGGESKMKKLIGGDV